MSARKVHTITYYLKTLRWPVAPLGILAQYSFLTSWSNKSSR